MRCFFAGLIAAFLCCVALLFFHGIDEVNDTPVNSDGSVSIPSDGSRYIPMAGDTIHCDDGSDYTILNADGYSDCGPLPSTPQEWSPDVQPEREVIHYRDASGDYLFMQNMYETLRMAYTVCGGEDGETPRIRLSVPEDIRSDAFSPWNLERVNVLADAGHGDTVCVEAWDMFKNGVYYKTVYEIGVDRGEAEHE